MPIGPTGAFPRADLRARLAERTNRQHIYVARRVLPELPVPEQVGSLPSLPSWNLGQAPDMTRAPGGTYARGVWGIEEATYSCKEYGFELPIDDRQRARWKNFVDVDGEVAEIVQDVADVRLERAAAAALFNTTTFTGSTNFDTVTNEWDDYAAATPAHDIIPFSGALRTKTGVSQMSQAALMSEKAARNVTMTADYKARMKIDSAQAPAMWNEQELAKYFGLKEVVVAQSSYNFANINQAEDFRDIWDDEYCLLYVPSQGRMIGGAEIGRCITWENDGGLYTVENYREDRVRGDVVRVRSDVDVKVWGAQFGFLVGNITS